MSAALSLDSIVHVTPDQLTCELDGESVILHARDGVYYGLDSTGTFIWTQLAKPVAVAAIRDAMQRHFDVDAERCETDLLRLLGDLVDHGLVVVDSK